MLMNDKKKAFVTKINNIKINDIVDLGCNCCSLLALKDIHGNYLISGENEDYIFSNNIITFKKDFDCIITIAYIEIR